MKVATFGQLKLVNNSKFVWGSYAGCNLVLRVSLLPVPCRPEEERPRGRDCAGGLFCHYCNFSVLAGQTQRSCKELSRLQTNYGLPTFTSQRVIIWDQGSKVVGTWITNDGMRIRAAFCGIRNCTKQFCRLGIKSCKGFETRDKHWPMSVMNTVKLYAGLWHV